MRNNEPVTGSEGLSFSDEQVAKLAFIGSLLAAVGDALTTVSAAAALENLKKSSGNTNSQANLDTSKDLENLRRQVDYLTKEVQRLRAKEKESSPWRPSGYWP